MPKGDKDKYTDKQKRKAEYIKEGYEDRGVSKKDAQSRAWPTVNKESVAARKEDRDAAGSAEFGADTPMKRSAQPEEIAPAFVYFASEADSSYVTGEVLTLLGGETTAG